MELAQFIIQLTELGLSVKFNTYGSSLRITIVRGEKGCFIETHTRDINYDALNIAPDLLNFLLLIELKEGVKNFKLENYE